MTRYLNYTNIPARWGENQEENLLTIEGIRGIRGVFMGKGVLYAWIQRQDRSGSSQIQFELQQRRPVEFTAKDFDQISVTMDPNVLFPCSGIITEGEEGYVIAPTVELVADERHQIVVMFVSPPTATPAVLTEKSVLSVSSEEGVAAVSAENGEIRVSGHVSGGYKAARIIVNRNPHLAVYREGFNQTFFEVKVPGEISAVWKPVRRNFEPHRLVFDPFKVEYRTIDDLLEHLKFSSDEEALANMGDYVIGDGVGVDYSIRLVLDHGLGRHVSDETRITITEPGS